MVSRATVSFLKKAFLHGAFQIFDNKFHYYVPIFRAAGTKYRAHRPGRPVRFAAQHIDINLPQLADRSMTLRRDNYARNAKLIKLQREWVDSF